MLNKFALIALSIAAGAAAQETPPYVTAETLSSKARLPSGFGQRLLAEGTSGAAAPQAWEFHVVRGPRRLCG